MIAIYAWRDWASSFSDGLSSIPLEASRESFRRARNGQTECPIHPRPDLRFSAFNGLVCPRHGLSAGGRWIRTLGPSRDARPRAANGLVCLLLPRDPLMSVKVRAACTRIFRNEGTVGTRWRGAGTCAR